jgi:MFS family permease
MTLPTTVFWLSVAQLVSWGSLFYTFALLLQPLETEFGFSRAQSSLAFSVALLFEGLFSYLIGRLIDRGNGRAVMSIGSLLSATTLLLHSFMYQGFQLYVLWAAIGIACSCSLYTPAFAILTKRYEQDYRRAITGLTFLGGLASTVFIPLSAWLIGQLGWRGALQVLAALHLLVCLPIHWFSLKSANQLPVVRHSDLDKPGMTFDSLLPILKTPTFLYLAAYIVLSSFVVSALPAHLIAMLRERHLDEAVVLIIPASIGVLQVVGRLLLFFFERYVNLRHSNLLIVLMMPLAMVVLATSTTQSWLVGVFAFIFGIANGLATIVKGTAIATYVDRDQVASLNGILGLPIALGRSCAPFVLGLLWNPLGGYQSGIILLVILSLVAALFFVLAARRKSL